MDEFVRVTLTGAMCAAGVALALAMVGCLARAAARMIGMAMRPKPRRRRDWLR